MLRAADLHPKEEAEAIYKLTSLCNADGSLRHPTLPPRRGDRDDPKDTMDHKQEVGFGFLSGPKRGM